MTEVIAMKLINTGQSFGTEEEETEIRPLVNDFRKGLHDVDVDTQRLSPAKKIHPRFVTGPHPSDSTPPLDDIEPRYFHLGD